MIDLWVPPIQRLAPGQHAVPMSLEEEHLAECDLMAQLAGLELESRSADWEGRPFVATSESHVSVWRKV